MALATPGIDAGDESVHLAIVDLPSDTVRTLRTGEDLGATWLPAGSSTFHSG
ncbi:MAG: hypothetical protein ACXVQJ_05165 [Actinomycetota bacterium]